MKFQYLLPLVCAILISCSSNDEDFKTDESGFNSVPENYTYAEINPSINSDYIEFIRKMIEEEYILGTTGDLCSGENTENSSCVEDFANITSDRGFYYGCLPGSCFYYIKAQSDSENFIVDNREELLQFLGDIDTRSEALLIAFTNGYYFPVDNLETGAFKEVNDGFELIGLSVVSDCVPLQTNRYRLKVKKNGELIILQEEVFSVDENSCI